MSPPSVGVIGFGEAGFHIGRGLKEAGLESIAAYDLNAKHPALGERIRRHAAESGVPLVDSPASLAEAGHVLISLVTADQAAAAARQCAPFLDAGHLYADLNSVSPDAKRAVEAVVTGAGARFVEGAIMAPAPGRGHRAPILLAGPDAGELVDALASFGMRMDVVSGRVGAAAAVKLCRSIVIKGLEALIVESALAAGRFDAGERVFASLEESFPGVDWPRMAGYMSRRVAIHGERRAREMDEAARMLDAIGIEPTMAAAAARVQDRCARLGIRDWFNGDPPEDYRAIAAAIESLSARAPATEDSNDG